MNWKRLAFFVIVAEIAGILGSFFVTPNLDWYDALNKPSYTPSGMMIGMIWIILYFLMGLSLYYLTEECRNTFCSDQKSKSIPVSLWWIQLMVNAIWTPVFFGGQEIFIGLIVFIILLVLVISYIITSFRIDKRASYLFIPYLIWGMIAISFNYQIWVSN